MQVSRVRAAVFPPYSKCWAIMPSRAPSKPKSHIEGGKSWGRTGATHDGQSGLSVHATSCFSVTEAAQLDGPPFPRHGQLVFYTHVLCPYAERVWLCLLEKGADFRLIHVDLSDKPNWYNQINPRMLVPALTSDDGQVHVESADICRWLATALREQGQDLLPSTAEQQQEMERLIDAGSSLTNAGLDLVSGSSRNWAISSGQTLGQRAVFKDRAAPLEAALAHHGGPYLLGEQLTLADVLLVPFVRRFDLALQSLGERPLEGALSDWLAELAKRPAGRICAGDIDRWLVALKKHRSLDFFDYETVGPVACHPDLAHLLVSD